MKVWVAHENDTLRTIAEKNHLPLEKLIALNPCMENPDQNIAGKPVYLPSLSDFTIKHDAAIPTCTVPAKYINNWIPLSSLEDMANIEYDVLIVGSGAGGGAVLWRLCEQWQNQGKRIGIIERGDLVLQSHARNIPTMNGERLTQYFNYVSRPLPGSDPDYPGARQLFALGGRTLFWYTFTMRMYLADLMKWPIPLDELETYYRIAELTMNVSGEFTAGSTYTEILLNRLWARGYSTADKIIMAADLTPHSYGRVHTDVFYSAISFFAKALNMMTPFDLAVNARAVQILHDQGKVNGVKVMSQDKKSYILKAKTVVLSASTFETPRLLLHSGIKSRALGHYLTNQSFMIGTGTMSRTEFPAALGTLGIMISQTPEKPYQVLMAGPGDFYWYQTYEVKPLTEEVGATFFCYGKVESRYENRITLNPYKLDEYGVPEIQVHFSFNEEDQAVIRKMEEGIKQIASSAGIRLVSRDGRPAICLMPLGDLHHDSGTCRIGDDPLTSAADQYGRIRGVSGLYVADNSALPSVGSENPTLTTVALSIRTADHIIASSKSNPTLNLDQD
jgi:choline dehydrogenase-like flavoprotein